MDRLSFKGVFPILITPFADDEKVDLDSLARTVSFMAETGMDGVTILGVLGEANRMLDDERRETIRTAVAAANAMPVVVGASHRGTRAAAELSRMAEESGAAAVMITPSQEPVPSEEKIREYFHRIATEISIPIVLQDHPASTGVHMPAPLILRLIEEIPRIACIKEEAVPTAPKIRTLKQGMKRDVPILTGLGALYGRFDLESGSDGFMTGFAFPEVLTALVRASREGKMESVKDLYRRFLPLIVFEQQPGVAIRKEIFRRRGLITSAKTRHPGGSMPAGASEMLDRLIEEVLPGVDISRPLSL